MFVFSPALGKLQHNCPHSPSPSPTHSLTHFTAFPATLCAVAASSSSLVPPSLCQFLLKSDAVAVLRRPDYLRCASAAACNTYIGTMLLRPRITDASVTITVSLPAVSADGCHSFTGLLVVVRAEDGSEGVPVPVEELRVRI